MGVETVFNHFPDLSAVQQEQFRKLFSIYEDWNGKINLISRKDFEHFYERHVLHSLGIAMHIRFQDGTSVLDIGTGGGFPGIPLAILFPKVNFHLIDSIGKKVKVVKDVVEQLELKNVTAEQIRAEEHKKQYHFVVSRAVTALPKFMPWLKGKFLAEQFNGYPNGLFYLKGGDLKDELKGVQRHSEVNELSDHFEQPFFESKKVVYIAMN